jgi:hypothetical protein
VNDPARHSSVHLPTSHRWLGCLLTTDADHFPATIGLEKYLANAKVRGHRPSATISLQERS